VEWISRRSEVGLDDFLMLKGGGEQKPRPRRSSQEESTDRVKRGGGVSQNRRDVAMRESEG